MRGAWLPTFILASCCCLCTPGSSGTPPSSEFAVPHDAEVQIISPRPGVKTEGGAVPLRVRLALRPGCGAVPSSWALSISLDEDGESTVVPGVVVDGELPALPPGAHSITIALVDGETSGALLGPRASVHFTVGVAPPAPEIVIEEPPAMLWRRASADDATAAQVRISHLPSVGAGWSGKVAINGIGITGGAAWQPSRDGVSGVEWRSHLGHLPDGLHMLDAELTDPSGAVTSRDRRYFELLTTNTSHPRGGLEFAADSEDCCQALPGGRDFIAPPVPEQTRHTAFSNADWTLVAREGLDVLEEWCATHEHIMRTAPSAGGRRKRFVVLQAAAVPLGNRLQFLAGGFLLGLLTQRAVLVDMGELSPHFELSASAASSSAASSSSPACRWNFGSMDQVKQEIIGAVGGADVWERDGWERGWGDGGEQVDASSEADERKQAALRTSAAVPMAWVELLACVNLTTWMPEAGVLHVKSNQNLAPFLHSNAHHRLALYGAFGQDAVGAVLRFVIKPAPPVRARLERMLAAARGSYLIGLQVRRRYGTPADRCPYKIELPGPDGMQRRPTFSHFSDARELLLLDCAASLARGVRGKVLFYVSSDTPEEVADAVALRLGWRNILDKGDAFYTDSHGQGLQDRKLVAEMLAGGVGDYSAHQEAGVRAVLDMWMLASADDLVITPSSTYGMMGAALNPARASPEFARSGPVYATKWGKCVRAVSRQPVCHSWLRIRRATCFVPEMLVPEFDMLCPDCTLWACPCDGANPCSSHTDPQNSLDDPRYTKHLPM